MALRPLEIQITSLGDRSPGDLRAQVKFQVDGGPKYVIKAVRVDVQEPFINRLIGFVKDQPVESEGQIDPPSSGPSSSQGPGLAKMALEEAIRHGVRTFVEWVIS